MSSSMLSWLRNGSRSKGEAISKQYNVICVHCLTHVMDRSLLYPASQCLEEAPCAELLPGQQCLGVEEADNAANNEGD